MFCRSRFKSDPINRLNRPTGNTSREITKYIAKPHIIAMFGTHTFMPSSGNGIPFLRMIKQLPNLVRQVVHAFEHNNFFAEMKVAIEVGSCFGYKTSARTRDLEHTSLDLSVLQPTVSSLRSLAKIHTNLRLSYALRDPLGCHRARGPSLAETCDFNTSTTE